MARGFTFLTFLLLAGVPCFCQIIIPGVGGYPGGGSPGGGSGRRYPQGGPGGPAPEAGRINATTFTGMLRSIGKNNVVIESDDKTITTVSTAKSTKYISVSGGSPRSAIFSLAIT